MSADELREKTGPYGARQRLTPKRSIGCPAPRRAPEAARAAPTSLFFATERVVCQNRVASLNAALAAAAALNEAQATTARVVGDASAPVERWWWQGIF